MTIKPTERESRRALLNSIRHCETIHATRLAMLLDLPNIGTPMFTDPAGTLVGPDHLRSSYERVIVECDECGWKIIASVLVGELTHDETCYNCQQLAHLRERLSRLDELESAYQTRVINNHKETDHHG